jgi:hypothetical protein
MDRVYLGGKWLPVKDGKIGEGVEFERIRRITGYLVGSLDRFNVAKQAEVSDRIKHDYTNFNEEEK